MVFVVLIFCFALGLEFEEFDGILIYIYMRLNWALSFEGVWSLATIGYGSAAHLGFGERERERNRGMRGKRVGREIGLRKK